MKKILTIFLLIVLIRNCLAIGVGPAFNNIDFQPDINKNYSFKVYNTDNKEFGAIITVDGSLSSYIDLKQDYIDVDANESFKVINYELKLPEKLEPGSYTSKIRVTEVPKGTKGASVITAALGVNHQINLNVPAKGKYLAADFYIQNKNLIITINNIGEQDIILIKPHIEVYEDLDQMFKTDIAAFSLRKGEQRTTTQSLASIEPGVYKIRVYIVYDELEKTIEKELAIGEISVEIRTISIQEFKLGEIAKIDVEMQNKWNKELKDLYIELSVTKNNVKYGSYKSESFDIDSRSSKTISTYWDTRDKELGNYDASFVLYYNGKTTQKSYTLTLAEKTIETKEKKPEWLTPLVIIIIILVILNILIFLIYFKRKKELVEIH